MPKVFTDKSGLLDGCVHEHPEVLRALGLELKDMNEAKEDLWNPSVATRRRPLASSDHHKHG